MPTFGVIGGGIVGSAVALELARRKAGEVQVFEKENSLGKHASGRNSGVIHSGINQKPGTLKANMCVEGSRRLREYCRSRKVSMNECGTLVVARHEGEISNLEELKNLGDQCGVPQLEIISKEELGEKEPLANGVAALFSPTGATVDSLELLKSVAQDAQQLGVKYRLGNPVVSIEGTTLQTQEGKVDVDHVINCAGLYADDIAHMMGIGLEYRVIPFRGEYMEVKDCTVRGMIYQPPDLRFPFLSIHLTRETDGRVLAGPNAVLALGREAYEKECRWKELPGILLSRQFLRLLTRREFLNQAFQNMKTCLSKDSFLEQVRSLVPGVKAEQLRPYRSGIRAQMVDLKGRMMNDILIEYGPHSTHVLNAVSPGMTCSLAFAEYIVDKILN